MGASELPAQLKVVIRFRPIPAQGDLESWLESRRPPAASVVPVCSGWLPQLPECGGVRLDGLPPPHKAGPVVAVTTSYRQVEAAYLRRIRDWSAVRIAEWYHLALTEMDTEQNYTNSSSVRRDVLAGGKTLASLGAWPWAAFADGNLPSDWRSDTAGITSIERWFVHGMELSRRRLADDAWQTARLQNTLKSIELGHAEHLSAGQLVRWTKRVRGDPCPEDSAGA